MTSRRLPVLAGQHPLPNTGHLSPDAIAVPDAVRWENRGDLAVVDGVQPATQAEMDAADSARKRAVEADVEQALRAVFDPELPVNIVDLGLIYAIELDPSWRIVIRMTLTAPACPVAGALVGQVAEAAAAVVGVHQARVALVWDPPWSQGRLSDETKLALGLL